MRVLLLAALLVLGGASATPSALAEPVTAHLGERSVTTPRVCLTHEPPFVSTDCDPP